MAKRVDVTIFPADFTRTPYLLNDTAQTADVDFIAEARDTFKLCDDILEEVIGLSELKFFSVDGCRSLEFLGGQFFFPDLGLAFVQFSKMLGIPAKLALTNPDELNEQLFAAQIANKTEDGEKDVIVKYRYNPLTQRDEIVAFLKGSFQTVKNKEIFEGFLEALGGHAVIDQGMTNLDAFGQNYIRFIAPTYLPGSTTDDTHYVCYDVQFSECIDSGVMIGLGLWRSKSKTCVAIPSEESDEAYKHTYKNIDPSAPPFILSRLIKEVTENAAIGQRITSRRDELKKEQMDLQTTLERLAYNGMPASFITLSEDKIRQDDLRTQWDLLIDLTRNAQDIIQPRRRRNIERVIGRTFGVTLAYDATGKKKAKMRTKAKKEPETTTFPDAQPSTESVSE